MLVLYGYGWQHTRSLLPESGIKMLFTKLKIKNLYSFKNTTIDFTFPKKPINSTIPTEHPADRPNINVKRFCVFTGANASGKTAIGKILCGVQNLLVGGTGAGWIYEGICEASKPASVYAEVISTTENWIYAFKFKFSKTEEALKGIPVEVKYAGAYITKSDYLVNARKKLKEIFKNKVAKQNEAYLHATDFITFRNLAEKDINKLAGSGWYYQLAHNTNSSLSQFESVIDQDILSRVLKTFDVSITNVDKIVSAETKSSIGYKVKFSNSDSLIIENDGDISKRKSERLSRGTYEAIKVALFLSRIVKDSKERDGAFGATYFLDEAMAYAHTELELSMINLIIEKLGINCQFFYTTHNTDILKLNVPTHSHYFIQKDEQGSKVTSAETIFKKNDRPLKNILNNDEFQLLPDTSSIDEMLWE